MPAGSIGAVGVDVEVDGSNVPGDVEKSATSGMKSVGSRIGKTLTDAIGAAAATGGAAIAATVGTALVKGFNRLEAIDTANAKLIGLGKTGDEIASIMKSATAAVKGTAFGLGDAASAAAQFSAAGIPLDQIERSLRVLSSSAAVAGTGLGDMTTIFGKVAATGKLNGEVLQQLSERGIPVLSFLAKQYGVTAEEARKMVSDGKVSFADFENVMEANLGPAAQAMGQSFRGMLTNVGAALGRLGAAAQGPAFESLKTLFPPIMSAIDQLTKVVKPLADALGTALAPYVERLATALAGIDLTNFAAGLTGAGGGAAGFVSALAPLLPLLLGAVGMLGPLATGLPGIGPLFAGITGPVGLLAGALIALLAFKPETLMAGFESIVSQIPGIIDTLVNTIVTVVPTLVGRLAANIPVVVQGFVNLLLAVIPAIIAALPTIVNAVLIMVTQLAHALVTAIPLLLQGALLLFQGIVTAVIQVIPQIITMLVTMIPSVITMLLAALPTIIQAALALFMGVVQGVVEAVPVILDAVMTLLPVLIETLLGMLPSMIDSALTLLLGVVTGVLEAIPDIIVAVLRMLPEIVSALIGMIPRLIQGAVKLFTGLMEALPIILPKLIDALIEIGPELVGAIIKLIPLLVTGGVDLISGLVKGLGQAAASVGKTLLKIAQDAVGGFLSFLGIHSPSRLMEGYGEDTMQGYINALLDARTAVGKAMVAAVKGPITSAMSVTAGASTLGPMSQPQSTFPAAPVGKTVNNTFEEGFVKIDGGDPYRAASEVVDTIAEEAGL